MGCLRRCDAGFVAGRGGCSVLRSAARTGRTAGADRPRIGRMLDLGCGWGFLCYLLARRFPECLRIDAINISPRQLDYCARYLSDHNLLDRVSLYLCDGRDVGLLPDPEQPYDLVIVRGVYTHFPNDVYEASVAALADRVAPGGIVIISDTLFRGDPTGGLDAYVSEIPDEVDRLACGNRKTRSTSPVYWKPTPSRFGTCAFYRPMAMWRTGFGTSK